MKQIMKQKMFKLAYYNKFCYNSKEREFYYND